MRIYILHYRFGRVIFFIKFDQTVHFWCRWGFITVFLLISHADGKRNFDSSRLFLSICLDVFLRSFFKIFKSIDNINTHDTISYARIRSWFLILSEMFLIVLLVSLNSFIHISSFLIIYANLSLWNVEFSIIISSVWTLMINVSHDKIKFTIEIEQN